jgi:ParB-like chromosome segregation protein Spo0J
MANIKLVDIKVDSDIQIRRGRHEATIRRYAEAFAKLPKIIVFQTPDALLVSDGFHRLAAAQRLGKTEIEADVRKGTYADALELAVVANAKNADALTPEERDEGIQRLKQLHPQWSLRKLADIMSVSYVTVKRALEINKVREAVAVSVTMVTPSHFREIAAAPREYWQPLAKAVDHNGWSVVETAKTVRSLKDRSLGKEEKRRLIKSGKLPMFAQLSEAEDPASVLSARARIVALRRGLKYIETARTEDTIQMLRLMDASWRLKLLTKDLPQVIDFLTTILATLTRQPGCEGDRNGSHPMVSAKSGEIVAQY